MWDLDGAITDVAANIYAKKARKGFSQTQYQAVLLSHPTFRTQYNEIMTGLLDGPLSEATLHGFLDGVEPVSPWHWRRIRTLASVALTPWPRILPACVAG